MRGWRMGIVALCVVLLLLLCTDGAGAYELQPADKGFAVAAETAERVLLFNAETLQLRLVDPETGKTWDTCVLNGQQGNKTIKNTQKSTLVATFISNAQNATVNTMDTCSKSQQTGTFEWENVPGGVEIRFTLGDDTLIIDDLPKAIRVDKYYDLKENAGWTSKEANKFLDNYRAVKMQGLEQEYMIRVKDDSLSALLIKDLYAIIFSSGIYTQEDMAEDNAAVNYERSYLPQLRATVRFMLDRGDLVVTIPCGELGFTEDNEITALDVLPYFLAADTGQEGYILVPDGSGALITLNNGKPAVTAYSMPVYGRDALINAATYVSPRQAVELPVFGLKRTDSAMLAIIEKGAEMANIYANISGRSDEFNRVNASFAIREVESVSLAGNESITSPRYCDDVYQGDIVLRYKWLTSESDGYLEMAQTYRHYLLERGALQEKPREAEAPFFMEILGAVKKDKFILGVPYASSVQATTISQAGEIYDAALAAGIGNVRLIFSGLFTGGIKNAALSSLRLDGGMGSGKELKQLREKLRSTGGQLYSGVYWGRVYTRRGFNILTQASRKHDGEPAEAYTFGEPILKRSRTDHAGYYVSPYYLPEYTDKALSALQKMELDGLNLFDLGNTPIGDYKRKQNLSRISAIPLYEQALETITGRYSLLLDAPLLYALPYADGATNLPSGDNGFAITDASIPFLQWVLDGSMPYSGSSWNTESYLGVENHLLWALESLSCPRFTFSWQLPSIFANTEDADYMAYFSVQYQDYLEKAAQLYGEFNAFYRMVDQARPVSHEILTADLRRVIYENGVTLYVNYGKTDALWENETIPAQGYLVREGGKP